MTETPVTYSAADDWDAAMAPTDTCVCPNCYGQGQYTAIVDPGCQFRQMRCSTCQGSGRVSGEILKRIEIGRRLHDIRVRRMVTLRDVADAIGSTPVQISHMEFGKEAPSSEYLAWCGVEVEGMTMTERIQGADR